MWAKDQLLKENVAAWTSKEKFWSTAASCFKDLDTSSE